MKPKQETLEEAMERLSNIVGVGGISDKHAFMLGTFWQQERSYSEEEVYQLLYDLSGQILKNKVFNPKLLEQWFKQFKKK